jgi:kynurenine formamidase
VCGARDRPRPRAQPIPGPGVGIDALNIDDTADGERPAHTLLLAAGIPVVEHLTGLEQLPPAGAWFTAAPPRIERLGTIPVRALARLPV